MNWAIRIIIAVAVLGVALAFLLDAGQVRTKAFVALDRHQRRHQQPPPPTAPPEPPPFGYVYPEIEQWTPERIEAFVDEYADCETAYVWAALAYRKQQRWAAFWATCNEIDELWPGHHFPKAMRQHRRRLGIPEPGGETADQRR